MAKQTISEGVARLRTLYKQGKEISKQIERKPGNIRKCQPGEFERVGKKFGVGAVMASKMVAFSKSYSPGELNELVKLCQDSQRVLGFDIIIQLLPIADHHLRRKLQIEAAEGHWSKTRLRQAMKQRGITAGLKENENRLADRHWRGKPPIAISSTEALLGELLDDAEKWHRNIALLKRATAPSKERLQWETLTPEMQSDLEKLKRAFAVFAEYEFV